MKLCRAVLLLALASCSDPPSTGAAAEDKAPSTPEQSAGPAILQTASGRYAIESNAEIEVSSLPKNNSLKMLDGDLAKYALQACEGVYEFYHSSDRLDRCELFVQPDKTGLLVGYVFMMQGKVVSIASALETDKKRGGFGCSIEGDLRQSGEFQPFDISKDFKASTFYAAWEKSPGDWMTIPDRADSPDAVFDAEEPVGVWYFERVNNNLRINQERWSPCYNDEYVDEVFTSLVTLVRTHE